MNGVFSHGKPYYRLVTANSLNPQNKQDRNRSWKNPTEHGEYSIFSALPMEEDMLSSWRCKITQGYEAHQVH